MTAMASLIKPVEPEPPTPDEPAQAADDLVHECGWRPSRPLTRQAGGPDPRSSSLRHPAGTTTWSSTWLRLSLWLGQGCSSGRRSAIGTAAMSCRPGPWQQRLGADLDGDPDGDRAVPDSGHHPGPQQGNRSAARPALAVDVTSFQWSWRFADQNTLVTIVGRWLGKAAPLSVSGRLGR